MLRPGDFSRGLGADAEVPIAAKILAKPCATRPGVRVSWGDCQGKG